MRYGKTHNHLIKTRAKPHFYYEYQRTIATVQSTDRLNSSVFVYLFWSFLEHTKMIHLCYFLLCWWWRWLTLADVFIACPYIIYTHTSKIPKLKSIVQLSTMRLTCATVYLIVSHRDTDNKKLFNDLCPCPCCFINSNWKLDISTVGLFVLNIENAFFLFDKNLEILVQNCGVNSHTNTI